MYSHTDIADITAQLKGRILAWLLPGILLMGLVVFSFIIRMEWLTAALFSLLCCLMLFALNLYILPVARYRRFLEQSVHGRQRRSVLAFKSLDNQTVIREGVACFPMLFSAGSPLEPMDDRLLYWDANLPLPTWQPGDKLIIFSHEKVLTRWETAEAKEMLTG